RIFRQGREDRRRERPGGRVRPADYGDRLTGENVITGAGARSYKGTCGKKKFRLKPFLKGLREWRGQSPFPGTYLPYFRSCPRLLHPKWSVRSTQNIILKIES